MAASNTVLKESTKPGAFIALEGIDGSGKSTQLKLLTKRLRDYGLDFYETAEPTSGSIGKLIRGFLAGEIKTDERTIAALFAADRLDHILSDGGLREKTESGINVITDRYYLSSYAYQSTAMPLEWVMQINSQSARILKPNCHIFIDISPETAVERISRRALSSNNKELFETLERLACVKKKYFEIFNILKIEENIVVVDGEAAAEKIADNIWKAVFRFFGSEYSTQTE